MAPITEEDRNRAWGLPDEFLSMEGPRADRVVDLVDWYWGGHSAKERARVVRRLLVILEPLAGRTTITDLLRERCVAAVILWLERQESLTPDNEAQ